MEGSLGLRRHTVRLVDHQESWAAAFDELAEDLVRITGLEPERIAHVGSTAIPGIPAKPILDVAVVAMTRDHVDDVAVRLAAEGYIDRGDGEGSIGRLVVLEPVPDVRSAHIHILEDADPYWDEYHRFLSLMLEDSAARKDYADLKRTLSHQYADDRRGYTAAKAVYVERLLASKR